MALEPQIFTLALGQGMDTKTDPKTLKTSFATLRNGVLKKLNRLSKRFGFTNISTLDSSGNVVSGKALATFGDELLQLASNRMYSYSPLKDRWLDRGQCYSVSVDTRSIVQTQKSNGNADAAMIGDVILSAYVDPTGTSLLCRLEDRTSGILLHDEIASSSAISNSSFRILSFKGKFIVIYAVASSNTLKGMSIDPLTAVKTETTIVTDASNAPFTFDAVNYNDDKISLVYGRSADVRVCWLDQAFALLTGSFAPASLSDVASSVTCAVTDSNTLTVAYIMGTGTKAIVYTSSFTVLKALTNIDSSATDGDNITIGKKAGFTKIFFDLSFAGKVKVVIYTFSTNTFGSAQNFMLHSRLASKAFTRSDTIYVGVKTTPNTIVLQSTFFIIDSQFISVVSKHQPGTAGLAGYLPNILQNVDTYFWPILYKTRLVSTADNVFSLLSLALTSITFGDNSNFSAVELGKNLHIVGGYLGMYDGASVVEHGFHLFPEGVSSGQSGSTGVAIGTYLYTAVYEWIDAKGNVHRSGPSVPIQVAVTGSAKNVAISVPTLAVTAKKNVSIVVYRTMSNQTGVFYRVNPITSPTYNSFTVDTVTITDTLNDTALASNEILYTSGGVLENIAPQACKFIAVYKNRIILAGLEDGTISYSKTWTRGGPVEFNDGFTLGLDDEGGPCTGVAVLDDKLIFPKKDRFAYTYGEGPDELGSGSFFPQPEQIPSDAGCIDQQSLVVTPDGLMFKSFKGYYLLSPSLGVSYIGAQAEDFNGLSVTSAVLKSDENQVRFTHSDGICLSYDYFMKDWYTFDNYQAYDNLIWKDQYVLLRTSGQVSFQNSSIYRDAGTAVRLYAETGWISFGDISGFQRVQRLLMVADYLSSHKIVISVGYDFEPTYHSTITFDSNLQLDPTKYGQTILASLDLKGGSGITYTLNAHLSRQKCEAIRFRIEELTLDSADGSGEGLSITSLGLLVGLKRGLAKNTAVKLGAS